MTRAAHEAEIPTAGLMGPGMKRFDAVMFGAIQKHQFPAASLAIAKEGRLVLARGYGVTDRKTREPARPVSMFGIGSVSKTITAAAVLKLVEEGRFRLEDQALSLIKELRPPEGTVFNPQMSAITVRMLLNHSAGLEEHADKRETVKAFKVAGKDELTPDQLVSYGLTRPLKYSPGTDAAYSSFGYVVLGQIVAHVTQQRYEEFVKEHVFTPMGIRHAEYGTQAETYPEGWVHRYNRKGEELEPLRPVAAGAAGIWVTSAVELMRFLTQLGGPREPRFLSRAMMNQMLAPPPPPLAARKKGAYFGLGWDTVQPGPKGLTYSKNGGLPGCRAFVGRMPGMVDWAFLATDITNDQGEDYEAAKAIQNEIDQVANWPTVDFFDRYR